MFKFLITVFLFLSSVIIYSQANLTTCRNVYFGLDTSSEYKTVDVIFNQPPYVYLTGSKRNVLSNVLETYTLKMDLDSGIVRWIRSVYNSSPEKILTNGNSVFVCATSNYQPPTSRDIYIQKYLPSGNPGGQYSYAGPGGDYVIGASINNTGNLFFTGRTDTAGRQLIITVKLDTNMAEVWQRIYVPPPQYTFCEGEDIISDASGNVYVTGFVSQGTTNTYNYITIKYNSSGTLQWAVMYNGAQNSEDKGVAISLHNTNGDGVVVTGYSTQTTTNYNITTIKYLADSTIAFINHFGGNASEQPRSMATDPAGNIYITGDSTVGAIKNFITMKLSPTGGLLWANGSGLNTAGNRIPNKIAYSSSTNRLWVTGEAYLSPAQNKTALTVVYNPSTGGITHNDIKFCDSLEVATSLSLDQWGGAYIGAYRKCFSTYLMQFHVYRLTADICAPIGIQNISNNISSGFALEQNYPNPFNPNSKIKMQIAKLSVVKLVVFDVLGREITTLVNEQLLPGTYEADFDGTNYPSGVYYYKLTAGDYIETKKMVLIK